MVSSTTQWIRKCVSVKMMNLLLIYLQNIIIFLIVIMVNWNPPCSVNAILYEQTTKFCKIPFFFLSFLILIFYFFYLSIKYLLQNNIRNVHLAKVVLLASFRPLRWAKKPDCWNMQGSTVEWTGLGSNSFFSLG